jgi:hypothetical protein
MTVNDKMQEDDGMTVNDKVQENDSEGQCRRMVG